MDVNVILKIAGVGLLTAIVCVILKKSDRDEIDEILNKIKKQDEQRTIANTDEEQ